MFEMEGNFVGGDYVGEIQAEMYRLIQSWDNEPFPQAAQPLENLFFGALQSPQNPQNLEPFGEDMLDHLSQVPWGEPSPQAAQPLEAQGSEMWPGQVAEQAMDPGPVELQNLGIEQFQDFGAQEAQPVGGLGIFGPGMAPDLGPDMDLGFGDQGVQTPQDQQFGPGAQEPLLGDGEWPQEVQEPEGGAPHPLLGRLSPEDRASLAAQIARSPSGEVVLQMVEEHQPWLPVEDQESALPRVARGPGNGRGARPRSGGSNESGGSGGSRRSQQETPQLEVRRDTNGQEWSFVNTVMDIDGPKVMDPGYYRPPAQ
ncbi:hypothetical protein FSARC_5950 [Fusarium sarcochroum]|uniref:Uncharacterized protein n=1 Tax=Fusarium sarcochroum TaxID=1208366 RepID=A0A8H4X9M1_9HYPO|nr:hypothetical protein FSARC_5950 [Fusarium sarcochroum]